MTKKNWQNIVKAVIPFAALLYRSVKDGKLTEEEVDNIVAYVFAVLNEIIESNEQTQR